MSPYFVKLFNEINKCTYCSSSKLEGYSLCPTHLEQAKIRWRSWQVERKQAGKCCYCDHKSFNGWLRCRAHTKINKVRCRLWHLNHPGRSKQAWEERKQKYNNKGLCKACKDHRPVEPGFKRCWICRKRDLLKKRNIVTNPTINEFDLTTILTRNNIPAYSTKEV